MVTWLAAFLLHGSAPAAEVVVFGDSWAEGSGAILGEALRDAGHPYDIVNYGVGGTTAAAWNDVSPNALVDAVTANPDARWVWLSILGNDVFALHLGGQGGWAAAINQTELTEMVDRLHGAHPDIKVVTFAYDWVNFEASQECKNAAWVYFAGYHTLEMALLGVVNTPAINDAFVRDIADVQQRVANDRIFFDAYRFYGTLQMHAGATINNPLLPSPASLMSDCIHPTAIGYRALHDELVDAYWGAAVPTAAVQGAADPVCRGLPHTLSTDSVGTPTWWIDGTEAGHDAEIVVTPSDATAVVLRVDHAAWRDEATATLLVVDPPVIDAGTDVSICEGDSVRLQATGAPVLWTPTDALDSDTSAAPLATPSETTTFVAAASTAPGCDATDDVVVTVLPSPVLTLSGPGRVGVGEALEVRAAVTEGSTVTWTVDGVPSDVTGPTFVGTWDARGVYFLQATASLGGCEATATWTANIGVGEDVVDVDAAPCGCQAGAWPQLQGLGLLAATLLMRRPRRWTDAQERPTQRT